MTKREACHEVLKAARLMYARGLANAFEGNVSIRVGGSMLITPSAVCKSELTLADLVEVSIASGETLWAHGGRKASSEAKLHLAIYRARADVLGVAHAHPPFATAYAVRGAPIESRAYPEMLLLFGKVPVAGYGRPGTEAVHRDVPQILQEYDQFLLENHGLVAVGDGALSALYRLESAEGIAKALTLASLTGGESPLPGSEAGEILALYKASRDLPG